MEYKPPKYFIKTYGCQANYADTSKISGILEALGFEKSKSIKESDLFIVNTCSVRQKSEDKVYGIAKSLKKVKKPPFVVMAGCMVGSVTGKRKRYKISELKDRTPWVDLYINPSQIHEIPAILEKEGLVGKWGLTKTSFNTRYINLNQIIKKGNKRIGYVNISYGCDNFCSFCVVPYAREEEISRSKEDIIRDISELSDKGYSHIMLCGQNVNSWGLTMSEKLDIRTGSNQKIPFAGLLREVHDIDDIRKISFLSSNPFDFTNDLVEAISLPKIDDFIHIAVQSGNNDVLKRMNRRHTIEEFISLISRIKKVKPDVHLGTDVIVGFPGETKDQFMDTVKLFEQVPFHVAFISIYSPRKGTPAEKFYENDVPLKEKKRRHAYLTKVWKKNKPKI